MAIITLVVYLADKESNGAAARFKVGERSLKIRCAVTIGVGFTLGRVYTHSSHEPQLAQRPCQQRQLGLKQQWRRLAAIQVCTPY